MNITLPRLDVVWLLAVLGILLVETPLTCADAIVVSRAMKASTIAEFFVDENGVRVELEIGAADLNAFRNLLPDALYEKLGDETRPLTERLPIFFQSDLVMRAGTSDLLSGQLVQMAVRQRLVRDEITGQPLPVQPDDVEHVVFVELLYSWQDRPESVSILPRLGSVGRMTTSNVGFVLYHDGVPVNDFRYLSAESTVDLDWGDPWYSRFRNRNLGRQYDAPLSVFLYVDFFEVRKEFVVRPKDLQQWGDFGLEGEQTIPVERQALLKQQVATFLAERGEVSVDGRALPGRLDRIHFIRRSLRATGVVDPPEPLDLNTATLGVIFVYPIERLPQEVTVTWDLFSSKIRSVPAVATDEAGGMPSILTADDPVLVWKNYLTNPTMPTMMAVTSPEVPRISLPVISAFCFGIVLLLLPIGVRQAKRQQGVPNTHSLVAAVTLAVGLLCMPYARASLPNPLARRPILESPQAEQVLHSLLYNVYRAFDVRDESLVYDRLANSISGDLLSDVYLQVRRSTELENQGGAQVKVDDVVVLDATSVRGSTIPGLSYRCRWTAAGSVGHWGHIHRRANQYDAELTIAPVDGVWKITAIDVRAEQRIDPVRLPRNL